MYRKVLVAITDKELDAHLIAHAKMLAEETGASLTLLRVITIADDGSAGFGRQFQLEIGSSGWRRKRQAEALLPQLAGALRYEGLAVESAVVTSTLTEAEEIVRFASVHGFDLIVMAYDKRPWYRRWISSSPADGILRRAALPTLLVGDVGGDLPAESAPPELNPVMALLGSATL